MRRIKKDDRVKIISGKDKGKEGKVLEVRLSDSVFFIVEGVNVKKKHVKGNDKIESQILELPFPISACKCELVQ